MNAHFERLLERAEQLMARIESVLPQPRGGTRLVSFGGFSLPQAQQRPWRAGARAACRAYAVG